MGSLNRGTAEQQAHAEQPARMGQQGRVGQQAPTKQAPAGGPSHGGPVRGGLVRYVAAATLARTADGGAVVAIVLMVTTSGAPGWLAGLLGACITAPHLLGPLVAR